MNSGGIVGAVVQAVAALWGRRLCEGDVGGMGSGGGGSGVGGGRGGKA